MAKKIATTLRNNIITTAFGIASAFFAFVLFSPEIAWPIWLVSLSKFALVGGLAGLGISAKDFRNK